MALHVWFSNSGMQPSHHVAHASANAIRPLSPLICPQLHWQVAMLLAAGMASLPESPRWLSLSGSKSEEAASALRMTLGKAATQQRVDDELKAMERKAVKEDPSGKDEARKFTEIFTKSSYRQPLLVGTSLMLFQQITGQPSVLYYAAQIFQVDL